MGFITGLGILDAQNFTLSKSTAPDPRLRSEMTEFYAFPKCSWANSNLTIYNFPKIAKSAFKNNNTHELVILYSNQRTNGPVNAHLISWPTLVKHKTYKT